MIQRDDCLQTTDLRSYPSHLRWAPPTHGCVGADGLQTVVPLNQQQN